MCPCITIEHIRRVTVGYLSVSPYHKVVPILCDPYSETTLVLFILAHSSLYKMALKQIFYISSIVALLAAVFSAVSRSITVPSFFAGNSCPQPHYTVRTLSYDPLIQHIENFITSREAYHLLQIA
jgi:polyferredoxin